MLRIVCSVCKAPMLNGRFCAVCLGKEPPKPRTCDRKVAGPAKLMVDVVSRTMAGDTTVRLYAAVGPDGQVTWTPDESAAAVLPPAVADAALATLARLGTPLRCTTITPVGRN